MNARQKQKCIDGCMIFSIGAVLYTVTEILWRGHSHWTMTITGGLCALLIHLTNRRMQGKRLVWRCLAGSGIITAMEFTVGCLVNLVLGWNVWDYSSMPFNIMGQVCLLYSIMWFFISIPAIALSTWLDSTKRVKSFVEFE